LEVSKAKDLASIEAEKFKAVVDSIGADTLASISQAGPEMQARLLHGLGIKSFMISDANSPIAMFSANHALEN